MITADYGFIYDLGDGEFALGLAGSKAQRTVRAGLQDYHGIPGPRPRIPADAKKLSRKAAGRALLRALGVL